MQVLAGLGNQTQQKLLNIPEAAAAVGVTNLQIPHTSVSKGARLLKALLRRVVACAALGLCAAPGVAVAPQSLRLCGPSSACLRCIESPTQVPGLFVSWLMLRIQCVPCCPLGWQSCFLPARGCLMSGCLCAVGQFRDLIREADRDRMLCDTLKKVLKLTKGWDAAREHALSAVNTDNRMRIWYKDDSMLTGLLFRCNLGNVDLENPVGEPWSALLASLGVQRHGRNHSLDSCLLHAMLAQLRLLIMCCQRAGDEAAGWSVSGSCVQAVDGKVKAAILCRLAHQQGCGWGPCHPGGHPGQPAAGA